MATLGQFENDTQWPREPGTYRAVCVEVRKGASQQKKTPFVELVWFTDEGYQFPDQVYVGEKTLGRLSHVARHVCNAPKDMPLPDDKKAASMAIAKHIYENAKGKSANVTVEQIEEEYIVQEGPDVGQKKKIKKRKVAFHGYSDIKDVPPPPAELPTSETTPIHTDAEWKPGSDEPLSF
jgi:hypothetical protein